MITFEFMDKLLTSLMQKEDMEIVHLSHMHSNYEKTVEAIKYIIDYGVDTSNGVILEFNSNYTQVTKRNKI